MNFKPIKEIKYTSAIMAICFLLLCSYMVWGVPNANHYTEVEQDVWNAMKYIVGVLLALIVWGLREFVLSVKTLTTTVSGLNTTIAVNAAAVKNIENDVSEINDKVEKHDNKLSDIEKELATRKN